VREGLAVLGHSIVYASAAILNRGAGFLLLPLYTNYLDPSGYGLLGIISITSEVVGAAIGIKLGTAMSRLFFDYTEERERSELVSTAILGLGSMVAVFSLLLVVIAGPVAAIVLGDRAHGSMLFLGVVGLLLNVIFTLGLQYLIVLQRSKLVLVVSTLRSVMYLGLGFLFVASLRMGVSGALIAIALTNALALVALILPLLWRIGLRFSGAKFRALLGFGAPLLPGQLAELLVKFTDRYLLVQLASLASAGVFFLGVRLSTILQLGVISPFNQIYIVRRFEAHGRNESDADAPRVFTYFFTILVSSALGLSLLAPQLLALVTLQQAEYYSAAKVIPLLAIAEVVRSLLLIVELGIFYAKIPRSLTIASLATLVVHVPLTAVMVAQFGALGAAGAVVVSTTFRLALTCRLARGLKGPQPQWRELTLILGAAVVAFGLATAIELALGPAWGVAGRLALTVAFPVLLLLSPAFTEAERHGLRRLVTDRLFPRKAIAS
jgi:O-antigen/teichoic acid export membrane protein